MVYRSRATAISFEMDCRRGDLTADGNGCQRLEGRRVADIVSKLGLPKFELFWHRNLEVLQLKGSLLRSCRRPELAVAVAVAIAETTDSPTSGLDYDRQVLRVVECNIRPSSLQWP